MKFKFDPNQEYQLEAVRAVTALFEGQGGLGMEQVKDESSLAGIYANTLSLSDEEVWANLRALQKERGIQGSVDTPEYDFSVEMETGTGKTYVYLRTIFELHKRYGWKKYIILVPSVAIREGVMKTLRVTQEHFAALYDNVPVRFYEYQSKNVSRVKHFADTSTLDIMVMTMQAFVGDGKVLNKERDQMQGERPITYIQKTRPILIMDEPQNMEGAATQEALRNFNALMRLRYSATHKQAYNLVYRLTPADAYRLGLVKKIEVYSVTDDDSGISRPLINLLAVTPGKKVKATLELVAKDKAGNAKKKKVSVGVNDSLAHKANNELYAGYLVDGMQAAVPGFTDRAHVRFDNGVEIFEGEGVGGNREEVMREEIRTAVRLHFGKREALRAQGIKPLSLFFIDRVQSYVATDGFIRTVFAEEYTKAAQGVADAPPVEKAHKGYFAMRGDVYVEREKAMEDNRDAFELIMRDKERLLSFDEPTEFIFSHSALKEGWDNPNIFTLCTLRETLAQTRKRQEIGRGMRLAVHQSGERVYDRAINLLSVVASESYAAYVAGLQEELREEGLYEAYTPDNARDKHRITLKREVLEGEDFLGLWEEIKKRTRYVVDIDTEELVEACAKRLHAIAVPEPKLRIIRAGVDVSAEGVEARVLGSESAGMAQGARLLDAVDLIKNETGLTRQTVQSVFVRAKCSHMFLKNPERFIFEASRAIREELVQRHVARVQYERIASEYPLTGFQEKMEVDKSNVQTCTKSIYDAFVFDSKVEQKFALDLEHDERIKLFVKLPAWYTVDTPVGPYNPDWAIVTVLCDTSGEESRERVYFVIETKGGPDLRGVERAKIDSAKKHFEVIAVRYKEVHGGYEEFVRYVEEG